jgi:hypothetical protein
MPDPQQQGQSQSPNWGDIAQSLPPMLPQEDYDKLRRKFFDDWIAPKVRSNYSVEGTWEAFKVQSDRPRLMTPSGRALVSSELGLLSAASAMLDPMKKLDPGFKQAHDQLQMHMAKVVEVAKREGMNTTLPMFLGQMGGVAIDFSMLQEVLGSAAGEIIEGISSQYKMAAGTSALAERALRGGLSFSAYDMLSNEKGSLFGAGAKGFAIGAAFDLALGTPGYLLRKGYVSSLAEGEEVIKRVATGDDSLPAQVQKDIAEKFGAEVEAARQEGRSKELVQHNITRPGARVVITDVGGRSNEIEIRSAKEYEAFTRVNALLKQGGTVDHLEVHPEDESLLNRYLRLQAQVEGQKYDTQVIKTAPGEAGSVARAAAEEGIPAVSLTSSQVELHTVKIPVPTLTRPSVADGARVPSSPPTDKMVWDAIVSKGGQKPGTINFIRQQVKVAWDPEIPFEDKMVAHQVLSKYPELLPPDYNIEAAKTELATKGERAPITPEMEEANTKALRKAFGREDLSVKLEYEGDLSKPSVTVRSTQILNANEMDRMVAGFGEKIAGIKFETEARAPGTAVPSAEIQELLDMYGLKPEEVDMEYLEEIGPAQIQQALETIAKSKIGKGTRPPPTNLGAFEIPMSEQVEYGVKGDKITAKGEEYGSLKRAIGEASPYKFLQENASKVPVYEQVQRANLDNRLMGSIEDVPHSSAGAVADKLNEKGWHTWELQGWEPGQKEIVYFRPQDEATVQPLIRDYDNFISKQAGRIFNSAQQFIEPVGDEAHARLGRAFGVDQGGTERFLQDLRNGMTSGTKLAPEIRNLARGNRLVLDPRDVNELMQGAMGISTEDLTEDLKRAGFTVPDSMKSSGPLMIIGKGEGKSIVWHERLHTNMMYANQIHYLEHLIPEDVMATGVDLAKGISTGASAYSEQSLPQLLNEAYVHAAEALRFGDKRKLQQLVMWDTDIEHILDFVSKTSSNLLDDSFLKGESVPVRTLQGTMWDLIRRTSPEVSAWLRNGVRITGSGSGAWLDPERGWILKRGSGNEVVFTDIKELWDYINVNDKNIWAPSASAKMQMAGVGGPLVPKGAEPDGSEPPNPDFTPAPGTIGFSGMSAPYRPMGPWVADLDTAMNKVFASKGQKLPLFDKWKDVDDAFRASGLWTEQQYEKAGAIFKDFSDKQMYSVFDYLTNAEKDRTPALAQKLGLTPKDVANAKAAEKFLIELQNDSHFPVFEYLQQYYPKLRGFGWDPDFVFGKSYSSKSASPWETAIRDGAWNPQDNHLGRFTSFVLRQGVEKKFTGEAIKDFKKLIDLKASDGSYVIRPEVRWPLENYVNYMRSIPDKSQQVINSTLQNFMVQVNDRLATLNKGLPSSMQLPLMDGPPRNILNRMMIMSYAMGLGGRPAIMVRDGLQALTGGMTVMGPMRFIRALGRSLNAEALDRSYNAGALLRRTNPGELFGDITGEMPVAGKGWADRLTKWSNMLLSPSRWGHNLGRNILYNGEYFDALEGLRQYRAGEIDARTLMKDHTSMWFWDKPMQARILRQATNPEVPIEDVARQIGLETTDLTLWPYRRGTQATALRYGAGRILGQYGVWPSNYLDFLKRIGRKWGEFPDKAGQTTAMWAAVSYSASHTAEALGVDTSRWFWQSPAGFAGSPHAQFVANLMKSPENTQEGRDARKAVLEYPLDFVPALGEMRAIMKAMDEGGDEWPPSKESLVRILGFKPLKEIEDDKTMQETIAYQLGYGAGRRRPQ